ncbi:hypothetical protein AGMMS49587_19740 [Spirochaetia bacterium]|nr:hypothetical protein AGMMS49587_19740 [Spirochaetia bacterium]
MDLTEIQKELLRTEYPLLQPDHDPDIERYYSLRGAGKPRDALHVFDTRLKPRYPDERLRTALFRTYRSHDPVYRQLLAVAYRNLTERSLDRVRRAIIYIDSKIAVYDKRDVYSTIKAAEDILRLFPKQRYEAIEGIERFYRYSQTLNFHVKSMETAVELVRAYHTQSLAVVGNALQRQEKMQQEAERQRRNQFLSTVSASGGGVFASVTFSPADLSRIEIPPSARSLEDQTLAYCFKYWNLVDDPAFERILFLYSRKYGKKNHDVYILIRQGKRARHRDDEILGAVLASLVQGYYYSILGDRYLQQKWLVLKNILLEQDATALAARSAASAAAGIFAGGAKTTAKKKQAAQKAAVKQSGRAKKQAVAAKKKAVQKKAADRAAAAQKPAVQRPPVKKPPVQAPVAAAAPPPRNVAAMNPAPVQKKRYPRAFPVMVRPSVEQRVKNTAGGSVSDRLRVLSGRSYDLYQERFLTHARPAIRKILGARRGIFFNLPEKAEDLVYNFLRDHYADPYMNWGESKERAELAALGFILESLNPVIDECFKAVQD